MASIIQVVLDARDRTGPAFASARQQVQSLSTATGQASAALATHTAVSTSAAARVAQDAQRSTTAQQQGIAVQQQATATAAGAARTAVQQAAAARQLAVAEQQATAAQLRASLVGASAADRVRILTAQHNRLQAELSQTTQGTVAYFNALTRATNASTQLSRAQQAQGQTGGAAPVLSRSFAGFTGQGALQAVGAAGLVTSFDQLISKSAQYAAQGQQVQVTLDQTRASLGALLGSQERATDVFDRAINVSRRYGFTQAQTAEALQASSLLIRDSTSTIEETISVLTRLATLNPAEGVSGASFAIAELASGDIVSLNERFRIGRDVAREWRNEIQRGEDPIAVLNRGLENMGIGAGAIQAQLTGAAGEQRKYNQAVEDLGVAINDVVTSSGWREFQTGFIRNATIGVGTTRELGTAFGEIRKGMQDLHPGIRLFNQLNDAVNKHLRDKVLDPTAGILRNSLGIGQAALTAKLNEQADAHQRNAEAARANRDALLGVKQAEDTSVRLPPAFAGFGGVRVRYPETAGIRVPTASPNMMPTGAPPQQIHIHNHIAGSVITEREVGEISHRYLVNLDRRNAGDVGFGR